MKKKVIKPVVTENEAGQLQVVATGKGSEIYNKNNADLGSVNINYLRDEPPFRTTIPVETPNRGIAITYENDLHPGRRTAQIVRANELDLTRQNDFELASEFLTQRAVGEAKFILKIGDGEIPRGIKLR